MVWARQLARRLRKQYSYIYQNIATYIVKNIATDPYKSEKNITRDPAKKPQFINYYRHTALRKVTTETTKSNFKSHRSTILSTYNLTRGLGTEEDG